MIKADKSRLSNRLLLTPLLGVLLILFALLMLPTTGYNNLREMMESTE
jgi:hypothetical protein